MLEPTDLSDHTTFLKHQSASGYAAELHGLHMTTALPDCPPLHRHGLVYTALSTQAASREEKPPELRKFYILLMTTISLNKHRL